MTHLVLIRLPLRYGDFGDEDERDAMMDLGDAIGRVVEEAGVGEFDGDEFGGGECFLYLYGPDADVLYRVVEPILRSSPLASGGDAVKRYGEVDEPNVLEVKVSWADTGPTWSH